MLGLRAFIIISRPAQFQREIARHLFVSKGGGNLIINFVAFHNRTATQLKAAAVPFAAQGFRFNSIAFGGH